MSNDKPQRITNEQLFSFLKFKSCDQLAVCQKFGVQRLEKLTEEHH